MTQDFQDLTHLLHRITDQIQHSPDRLPKILTISVCEIRRFLDIDCVQIWREEANGNCQNVAESYRQDRFFSLSLDKQLPLIDHVPTSDRPVNEIDSFPNNDRADGRQIRPPSTAPHSASERSTQTVRISVSFPIQISSQKWGSLRIEGDRSQSFSIYERKLLQMLANQISIGIKQYELQQQVQQQAQQNDTLNQISNLLRSSRSNSRNLQQVLKEILSSVGGIGGRLYLQTEPTTDQTCQLYTWGEQPTDSQLETHPSWQAWLSVLTTCESLEKWNGASSRPSDLICIRSWTPFPAIIADFHPNALPQPLSQVFASTSIRSIMTISLDYDDRCVGYLSLFRSSQCRQKRTPHAASVGEPQTLSWSVADIRFVQSASLYLYLWLLSRQVRFSLNYQASHDLLTCLPNRKQFELRLDRAVRRTRRENQGLAVAVLDLDGFKRVNYTLGHPVGDCLLLEVTQRLQRQLPPSACLARWGDDRFTFLLEYTSGMEELTQIAQTILNILCHPFHLENQDIYITASLGVAIAPTDGNRAIALLQNAEIAMHQAKRSDQNSYQFYASEMNRLAFDQLVLEADLRKASARNEFWLDYQPQIELTTGKIVGMEALLRWQHPTLGTIPPDRFIGLAEETGLICAIGEWVIRTACLQQRSWVHQGVPPVRISVNLSARQLQPDLVATIAKILHDTQMNPRDLELEITESVAVQNLELTVAILREFQAMGITVALDDFGTGYSCLSAVEQLPLNIIKIDRSLIGSATQNPRIAAIAKTVLALGQGLNLLVLAEGVETLEQLEFLKSLHCDLVQGNFVSAALSGDLALEFLRKGSVFIGIERVKLTV
jgi:diguanylate cyclase (GGDEF)-like protein